MKSLSFFYKDDIIQKLSDVSINDVRSFLLFISFILYHFLCIQLLNLFPLISQTSIIDLVNQLCNQANGIPLNFGTLCSSSTFQILNNLLKNQTLDNFCKANISISILICDTSLTQVR